MSLVQLYIPSEVAHDTIYELAEMGNFQFKDVSDASIVIALRPSNGSSGKQAVVPDEVALWQESGLAATRRDCERGSTEAATGTRCSNHG